MKRPMLIFGFAAVLLVGASGYAFATFGSAGSSGGWQAFLPSDAPYISHTGYSVKNTDTVSGRYLGASVDGIYNGNGNTQYTIVVNGKNNGQQLRCYLYGIDPNSGATISTTTTNFNNGLFSLSLSLTPAALTQWYFTVSCALPKDNGTQAEIYGHVFSYI